ncbi:hypothetical protein [Umezawaea sp. Da 62-37]|uniref:hypothetical protein n=1 Tax=Umezawaea sp. Da 62-37 TaxID=3075927 RepID=UPI0028F6F027|nr:hypothetical protein [Umezawaea sp. Da 62-37]WNV91512.1 hypothetical protein RM788_25615 [Umezawaea sp. Da 62-37]
MPDIEQELRAVADFTAPPSTTALDDVLRRGRRRVYALRAGAVAGVVAMVAGAGFATSALRSVPAQTQSADGSSTTGAPLRGAPERWRVADLPAQTPLPATPNDLAYPVPKCSAHWEDQVAELRTALPRQAVADGVGMVVDKVAGGIGVVSEPKTAVLRPGTPEADYHWWVDLTDVGGTGSVDVGEGRYPGTPQEAADREAFLYGNCEPPNRMATDDGTILQYTPFIVSEPFQTVAQAMRIYRPDGVVVEIVQRNFGSRDFRVNDAGTDFDRLSAGRGTLPLDVEAFRSIGAFVADVN